MNKIALLPLLFLLSLTSFGAFADPQTVTLEIPTMNCVTCPITVKKALQNVEGVSEAEVTFDTKLAVVTYDDEIATIEELTNATKNAGYPSELVD